MTTKIHTAVDGLGNPLRFILSPGQAAACTQAESLLAGFPAQYVIADRGYDSHKIVEVVEDSGAMVVIPSRACVKEPRTTDFALSAERYRIECFFNRLKHYRAIAVKTEIGCPQNTEVRCPLFTDEIVHSVGSDRRIRCHLEWFGG
ncbi:transposase [Candidatus Nitrospira nitrosa]|uniref:transposase n=1 Tax=Candidatus Nitrospira nitrosa TaxID=1742972 RepID=UPI0038B25030